MSGWICLSNFLNAILPIGQRSLSGCGHHLRHWTCEHPCGLAMTALKHSPPEPSPHTSLIVFTGSEPRARPALGTFCPARSCPRCRKPQRPISTSDFLSVVSRSSSSERSPSAPSPDAVLRRTLLVEMRDRRKLVVVWSRLTCFSTWASFALLDSSSFRWLVVENW